MEGPRAQPDRHARTRRLHVRGLPVAPGLRGRRARGRRGAGDRSADARERLSRDRERSRDRPGRKQDRPAVRRPRRCGGRGLRAARRVTRGGRPDLGEDGAQRRAGARRHRRADSRAARRRRRAAPRARLRLVLRPVPRRDRVRAGRGRHAADRRRAAGDGDRHRLRGRGARLHGAGARAGGHARRGRGGLRRDGPEGRLPAAGGGHADAEEGRRDDPTARLQGREADGVRGALPLGLRRLPRASRRAREAQAERRRALLRAGDVAGARVRLSLRVPRAAPHGDRPGAAGSGSSTSTCSSRRRTSRTASCSGTATGSRCTTRRRCRARSRKCRSPTFARR